MEIKKMNNTIEQDVKNALGEFIITIRQVDHRKLISESIIAMMKANHELQRQDLSRLTEEQRNAAITLLNNVNVTNSEIIRRLSV